MNQKKKTFIYGKYILDNVNDFSGLSGFCEVLSYFKIKKYTPRNNQSDEYQTMNSAERFYVQLFEQCSDHDGQDRSEEKDHDMRKKNNQQLVKDFNRFEKINIIVGSDASSEALTFLDIERIHIVDPWWNLARAHQVLGRGIRHRSHDRLLKSHRFKEIFVKTSHDQKYLSELLNQSIKKGMIEYMSRSNEQKGYTIHLERIQSDFIVDVRVVNAENDMITSKNGKGYDFLIQFKKTPLDIYHIGTTSSERNRISNITSLFILNLNDRTNKKAKERYLKLQRRYLNSRQSGNSRNNSSTKKTTRTEAELLELNEYERKEQATLKYERAPSLYRDKSVQHDFLEVVYRTCYTEDVKGIAYEDWDAMITEQQQGSNASEKNSLSTQHKSQHHLIPIKNIQREENLKLFENTHSSLKVYDIQDIPLNIYLHCALPNMQQYNQILTNIMRSKPKMLESHKIYQLHQYERASEREKAICLVTGFLIENSIDLYLNPYDYSKDLYLPPYYKKRLEWKKSLYNQQLNSTNYDIFSRNYDIIDLSKNSVLKNDPVLRRVEECITEFFEKRHNNAIMVSSLWNFIKKECKVESTTQFKRYILNLRSKNILSYKMGYIKLQKGNDIFDYHESILQQTKKKKKTDNTNEYNLESIKTVLNVSNKVKLLNQYCNIQEDNNDLSMIGEYLSRRPQDDTSTHDDPDRRGQKRPFEFESNSDDTIINVIESLPSEKRQKILESSTSTALLLSSSSSAVASRFDEKQSIIECLLKDPRYIELDESLQKIMIGIKTNKKYYIYILNDNLQLQYKSSESTVKSELNRFLESFIKKNKHTCQEYISLLEHYLKRDEVLHNWKSNVYPIILSMLERLESSINVRNAKDDVSSFTQLSFDDKLSYASRLFDDIIGKDFLIDSRKDKIFHRFKKKLIDYASLESKSDFIKIKDRQIEGTTFFYQISIWIFLMRINCSLGIEPFDEEHNTTTKSWVLFYKKYLIDKRIESTGRDINTLFFPNMFELLSDQSFFSEEEIAPIKSQLTQYVEYTKMSNGSKTENLQGIKIKHWRAFVKESLQKRNLVFSFFD